MLKIFLTSLFSLASAAEVDLGAYFVHKTIIIPHDQKKYRGGEDAAATSDSMLTVADGVGGWARHGVDPGLFTRELVSQVLDLHTKEPNATLRDLVDRANLNTRKKHRGSATVTTMKIVSENKLLSFNVGDSGYSHWRIEESNQFKMLYESAPGQMRFNFPYQVGENSPSPLDFGDEGERSFIDGDIFVLFTDGVCDNLVIEESVAECLKPYTVNGVVQSLSLVADCIAIKAYHLGKDPKFDSPFAKGARQSGMPKFVGKIGGKPDDITVTVAQVFNTKDGEPRKDHHLRDIHRKESIFTYTGPVGTVASLPSLPKQEEIKSDL